MAADSFLRADQLCCLRGRLHRSSRAGSPAQGTQVVAVEDREASLRELYRDQVSLIWGQKRSWS